MLTRKRSRAIAQETKHQDVEALLDRIKTENEDGNIQELTEEESGLLLEQYVYITGKKIRSSGAISPVFLLDCINAFESDPKNKMVQNAVVGCGIENTCEDASRASNIHHVFTTTLKPHPYKEFAVLRQIALFLYPTLQPDLPLFLYGLLYICPLLLQPLPGQKEHFPHHLTGH